MIGIYELDIFEELENSKMDCAKVDFINGTIKTGDASNSFKKALQLYAKELPNLCNRHGANIEDFQQLDAIYFKGAQRLFFVEIQDKKEHYAKDEYEGLEAKKIAKTKKETRKQSYSAESKFQ